MCATRHPQHPHPRLEHSDLGHPPSAVTGFPCETENNRLIRIDRRARTSPNRTSFAAPLSAPRGSSNSARTHSESVSFRARARASKAANSSSLTFVLTLLMRSGGFSKHRLAGTLNWILQDGRTKPVRRWEGQQGAGRGLRD